MAEEEVEACSGAATRVPARPAAAATAAGEAVSLAAATPEQGTQFKRESKKPLLLMMKDIQHL